MKKITFFKTILFFTLCFFCTTVRVYGQYICTDVNPDLVSTGNSSVDIDLNNDATIDFRLTGIYVSPTLNLVIAQASQVGLSNSILTDGGGNVLALAFNASIGPTNVTWHQMNSGNQSMMLVNNVSATGTWVGAVDQFIGLQLVVGANTYYGWARFSFSSTVNTYTFKDYAYNSVPNQPIPAGIGCPSITTPLFSLPPGLCAGSSATLLANTGNTAAANYTWVATPSGPVFSASSASATTVTFTASGTYTIFLATISGTVFGYTTHAITVFANPVFTVSASSPSVCPGSQFTLAVTGTATSYTFTAPPSTPALTPLTFSSAAVAMPLAPSVTYTVQGDSFGCLLTHTLTVNELMLHPLISVSPATICSGSSATLTAGHIGGTSFTIAALTGSSTTGFGLSSSSPYTVNPVIPTAYTIFADSAGCTGAAPAPTVQLQITAPLELTVAATPSAVCPGNSAILSVTAAAGSSGIFYSWTQSSGSGTLVPAALPALSATANPVSNSTYSLHATDAAGCTGDASVFVGTDPSISFPITAAATSSVLCAGQSVTLTATSTISTIGNVTYSWLPGAAVTGPAVAETPSVSTTYSVTGSNNLGCTAEASVELIVGCTGIEQASANPSFKLYPNPVNDILYLQSGKTSGVIIEVQDLSGRACLTQAGVFNGVGICSVDVHSIPAGIYLVKIHAAGEADKAMRFIKQ